MAITPFTFVQGGWFSIVQYKPHYYLRTAAPTPGRRVMKVGAIILRLRKLYSYPTSREPRGGGVFLFGLFQVTGNAH